MRNEDYTEEQYAEQFAIRIDALLAKIDRMQDIYSTKVKDTPEAMKNEMKAERERLEALKAAKGAVISPVDL